VTGKRIGVADIVRGVMNGADVREADDADNEKTKGLESLPKVAI
jgi:hypothetical protein